MKGLCCAVVDNSPPKMKGNFCESSQTVMSGVVLCGQKQETGNYLLRFYNVLSFEKRLFHRSCQQCQAGNSLVLLGLVRFSSETVIFEAIYHAGPSFHSSDVEGCKKTTDKSLGTNRKINFQQCLKRLKRERITVADIQHLLTAIV